MIDDEEETEPEPVDEIGMAKEAKVDLEIELGRPVSWDEFRQRLAGRDRVAVKTQNE